MALILIGKIMTIVKNNYEYVSNEIYEIYDYWNDKFNQWIPSEKQIIYIFAVLLKNMQLELYNSFSISTMALLM